MAKRILGYALGLLFAVVFGAVGWFAGLQPLGQTTYAWWDARHWVAVKATVEKNELVVHKGRRSSSYSNEVRYLYTYRGVNLFGQRVSLYDYADNVDDWHQQIHQRLALAQARGEEIDVWVNPDNPKQSLIDREIRWRRLALMMPFAIIFPCGALLGLYLLWSSAKRPDSVSTSTRARKTLSPHSGAMVLFVFGAVFTIIGASFSLLFIRPEQAPNIGWLVLIFPVVGIGLMIGAVRVWFGGSAAKEITLQLASLHVSLGEHVRGQVTFTRQQQGEKYFLSLICEHVDPRGDSDTRQALWSDEQILVPFGHTADFDFVVPANQQNTHDEGETYIHWLLRLMPESGSQSIDHEVVVLGATLPSETQAGEGQVAKHGLDEAVSGSAPLVSSAAALSHTQRYAEPEPMRSFPPEICAVDEGSGYLSVKFNPNRFRGDLPMLAILTVIFMGVGGLMFVWVLKPIGIVVCAIGMFFLYGALRCLKDGIEIECDKTRLKITRSTVFGQRSTQLDPGAITKLVALPSNGTTNEPSHLQNFELFAITRNGHSSEIFRSVKNAHLVKALMQKMVPFLAPDASIADMRDMGINRSLIRLNPPENLSWAQKNARKLLFAGVAIVAVASYGSFFLHFFDEGEDTNHPIKATADAWFTAMDAERLADLQAIAKLGFPIDTPTESGGSALAYAATRGNLEITRWLLDAGADIHHRNSNPKNGNYKSTPLMRAGYGANPEVMALLLARGARLGDVDAFQRTPLHFAAWGGCVECIRMLVDKGLSLEARATGDRGETPLMSAAGGGRLEGVKALLALGADLNAKDDYGYDALGWAEFHQRPEIIDYLKSLPR